MYLALRVVARDRQMLLVTLPRYIIGSYCFPLFLKVNQYLSVLALHGTRRGDTRCGGRTGQHAAVVAPRERQWEAAGSHMITMHVILRNQWKPLFTIIVVGRICVVVVRMHQELFKLLGWASRCIPSAPRRVRRSFCRGRSANTPAAAASWEQTCIGTPPRPRHASIPLASCWPARGAAIDHNYRQLQLVH